VIFRKDSVALSCVPGLIARKDSQTRNSHEDAPSPERFSLLLTAQILVAQTPKEPSVPPVSAAAPSCPNSCRGSCLTHLTYTPPPGNGAAPAKFRFHPGNVDGPYVALTFRRRYRMRKSTPRLPDMLKQRGVHCDLFRWLGQNAAEYPEILKRIVAEGHQRASLLRIHTPFWLPCPIRGHVTSWRRPIRRC